MRRSVRNAWTKKAEVALILGYALAIRVTMHAHISARKRRNYAASDLLSRLFWLQMDHRVSAMDYLQSVVTLCLSAPAAA